MRLLQALTARELQDLYCGQRLTLKTIGKMLGCSRASVRRRMDELAIPLERVEVGRRISKAKMGHEVSLETRQKISEKQKGKHSSPATEFKNGMVPWNKAKHMTAETVEKIAATKRGIPSWNKGISMHEWMPENSNKIRKVKIKQNNPRYWLGKKRDPETIQKIREIRKLRTPEEKKATFQKWIQSLQYKPNKSEQKLIDAFREYDLPYKYIGDGKIMIDGLFPDFINCNGQKKLIELFGEPFHKPEEEQTRKDRFAKYGFKTLIIWSKELSKMDDVIAKVENFTRRP